MIVNVYTPNSGTNEEYRLNTWDNHMYNFLKHLKQHHSKVVFLGVPSRQDGAGRVSPGAVAVYVEAARGRSGRVGPGVVAVLIRRGHSGQVFQGCGVSVRVL